MASPAHQHVIAVYGTRPEAIKMAPVVEALRRRPHALTVTVCSSGQHGELLTQAEDQLGLAPDVELALMTRGQSLNGLTAAAVAAFDRVLAERPCDWLIVQGDTTTAMAAALAAFHRGVKVAHVEAGLRTGDLQRPFPEEANRRMIDTVAAALFAPTPRSAAALAAEGHGPDRVFLVGNTVVDVLHRIAMEIPEETPDNPEVLVTLHRRESFGQTLLDVFGALRELAEAFPAVRWVYPVHPNPNVRGPAEAQLGGLPNLELHAPFAYRELVRHLRRCRFVLTDSGGLQEEAPAFGKPVLIVRETTERPEGVDAGVARLVGVSRPAIVGAARELLTSPAAYAAMARAVNPYGDGHAAERIAAVLAGEAWTPFSPATAAPETQATA